MSLQNMDHGMLELGQFHLEFVPVPHTLWLQPLVRQVALVLAVMHLVSSMVAKWLARVTNVGKWLRLLRTR